VNAVKNSAGAAFKGFQQRPSFQYSAGPTGMTNAHFDAGATYYWNLRNRYSDGSLSCAPPNSCNMQGGLPQ
jgi:hypothetical protein